MLTLPTWKARFVEHLIRLGDSREDAQATVDGLGPEDIDLQSSPELAAEDERSYREPGESQAS